MDSHSVNSIIPHKFSDNSQNNTYRGSGEIQHIDITEEIQKQFKTTHDTVNIKSILIDSISDTNKYKTLRELITSYTIPHMESVFDITEKIYIKTNINRQSAIIKKVQEIANRITDINVIFLLHIDNEPISFISSKSIDSSKDNMYFYINKHTTKLRLNIIIHNKDGKFALLHSSSYQTEPSEETAVATEDTTAQAPEAAEETAVATEDTTAQAPEAAEEEATAEEATVTPREETESVEEEAQATEAQAVTPREETESVEEEAQAVTETEKKKSSTYNPKYTYNPEDIHTLLKKVLVTNTSKSDDSMNKEYLIGNPFGYNKQYKNLYSQVKDTDKYMLSGRLDTTTDKIVWLRLLE